MMFEMKKILIALTGILVLAAGCQKLDRYIEQTPGRIIVDYTPSTFSIPGVNGTVTLVGNPDWISVNGNQFTVRRNTSGLIRRAEFTFNGNQTGAVNQRAHGLDAAVSTVLARNGNGDADIRVNFATSFIDDYEGWGVIYGKENNRDKGQKKVGVGKPSTNGQVITLDGLEIGKDYFVWGYVTSTEGDIVYGSNTTGIIPPVLVKSGDDLQAKIDNAKEFAEVRVEAGATFNGVIKLRDNVKLSGGWINNYSEQDFSNRSIIDGQKKGYCVESKTGAKNAAINGFEIINGTASGIVFNGTLTVEWCRVAFCENSGQGGGICCTEQPGDNLILANSVIEYNKADAHGGGVAINGAGASITVVNTLFHGNASIAQYGYTGALHGQAGVSGKVVNTTFVENVNWRDGSSATSTPWSCVMYRNGGTHIEFVNNIVAGNWYFLPGVASDATNHPDRYDMPIKPEYLLEVQVVPVDMNVIAGDDPNWIFQSNVLGGADASNFIGRAGNGGDQNKAQAACKFVNHNDWKTLFADPDNGDFHPAGAAKGYGENSDIVNGILGAYTTDLDGNPRATNGSINAGCYQPK